MSNTRRQLIEEEFQKPQVGCQQERPARGGWSNRSSRQVAPDEIIDKRVSHSAKAEEKTKKNQSNEESDGGGS